MHSIARDPQPDAAEADVYPELRDLQLDSSLLAATHALIERVRPHLDWPYFGTIPGRRGPPGGRAERRASALPNGQPYSFLELSSTQDERVAALARERGPAAATLFKLLCLSEFIGAQQMVQVLSPRDLDELVGGRVLIQRGDRYAASMRFVPYGSRFYLADSLLLGDNKLLHGLQPVYLSFETHEQVAFLRRLLAGRKLERALEIGCGTGLVTLELASHVRSREGADLHERSVQFALLNRALHGDQDSRFYVSDLLRSASGAFDLIVFNPFKVTIDSFDFLRTFFEQAFARLTPTGTVLLVLHAQMLRGHDPVFAAIVELMTKNGRAVRRTVFHSGLGGDGSVHSISFLTITPGSGVSLTRGAGYAGWMARRMYARLRG
jgi:SAM-dependent methyltransferase